jgi:nitrate/nitrite transport system ATP-binding protein
MANPSFLETESLAKAFPGARGGSPLTVFENVDMALDTNEFVCMIGHSGCGKSTILNLLAGLDEPSEGYIFVNGKEVKGPSIDRGVIFQNHSLLPWKSALSNVMFATRARWPGWSQGKIRGHARHYLELVGLKDAANRRPAELSGGMRQRVGIARAFAIQPQLLLMDEPFGALDALTRGTIQDELLKIWSEARQTVFMITHDVDEAMLLSDRILLMTNGPNARIAESVRVDIPRPRIREEIIHHPRYYEIRNHLMDFLVRRSHELN